MCDEILQAEKKKGRAINRIMNTDEELCGEGPS